MKNNSPLFSRLTLLSILIVTTVEVFAQTQLLNAPPQDRGLPYTRSSRSQALEAIKGTIAIFAGSRYAYVNNYKVRLDTKDILRAEAILKNGKIFVPEAFAIVIAEKKIQPKPIPKGLEILKDRWVYEIDRPDFIIPFSVEKLQIKGATYFAAADLAKTLNKKVMQTQRGLLLISDNEFSYKEDNPILSDCIVSIFDTPEKLMDPAIATRNIPILKEQGKWTEHAKVTALQLKDLENGSEVNWPETPRIEYDFTGFNYALLGTKVPSPGIYPRLLFSPDDLPMLKQHIKENKSAMKSMIEIEVLFKKTWWNPSTEDGKLFEMLASGKIVRDAEVSKNGGVYALTGLTKDFKPGIATSHTNYITNCLTTMALYCLLTDNNKLGEKVATSISNYYKLVDKNVDEHLKMSDSEFGTSVENASNSETDWRGMHGVVPHMDLALSLDFAGKFMTPEQRRDMQLLIAKATYGRRTGGGDGPRRAWRDINHLTWHLTHHLAIAAIEGLDGFDPEAYASGCELTRDFLEWGIDKNGQMFESNGKSGGGFQFEILAMILQARRGDNLFGHPHLRKMLTAQVYTTSPNRKETLSSGTWGGSAFSLQSITELKAFYPTDRSADYLIQEQMPELNLASFDLTAYRSELEKNSSRVRLPGPSYPGFVMGFPYITDWKPTTRGDLNLPLDWNTDVQGILSTSSEVGLNASWLCLHVRANHYIGSGHHHSDIGMFYFSGLGVNWVTESPNPKVYAGKYHNEIIIDGKAEADGPPAKGIYLGANIAPSGSFGSVDQTYCYTWQWCTQVQKWGEGFSKIDPQFASKGWELEPDTNITRIFRGTTNYKMRPWWPTYNYSNFIPTLRALWNPVEYVYRSAGLIKGDHPYSLIIDDAKKDDKIHLYQWAVMLAKGVWKADYKNIPNGASVLAYDEGLVKTWAKPIDGPAIISRIGDPMLLVYDFSFNTKKDETKVEVATDGPADAKGVNEHYNRLTINKKNTKANYRVLMLPFRYGEDLPLIEYKNDKATIKWKGQIDVISFQMDSNNRSHALVQRNGQLIVQSK